MHRRRSRSRMRHPISALAARSIPA
jgi:hypothetical protein